MEGVAHTVEVTPPRSMKPRPLGLKQIRGNDWVEGIEGALNPATVCIKNVQVEHTVLIGEFSKWLERKTRKSSRDDQMKDD